MKTCKEINKEFDEKWNEIYTARRNAIRETKQKEFPIGTKVRWDHGRTMSRGVVIGFPQFNDDNVTVQNSNNKNKRDVEAWRLELDV